MPERARPRVRARGRDASPRPAQGALAELARELITHSLMVLSVPGRILALGTTLDDPYPESLRELTNAELAALVARFEPAPAGRCGASDWSDFEQRMHYIVHLFRCFHEHARPLRRAVHAAQVERFLAGVIPEGEL